jgi:hypothetical protein
VKSLVTLDYEIETSIKEETIQIVIVQNTTIALENIESIVLSKIRIDIQTWWPIVLCYKRQARYRRRFVKSAFRYRRRRYLKLKKEIDLLIIERPPLDYKYLQSKYCDCIPVLLEYAIKQQKLKDERIAKYSRIFFDRLHVQYVVTKEIKYQEWLRLQELLKIKPLAIKSVDRWPKEQLIC